MSWPRRGRHDAIQRPEGKSARVPAPISALPPRNGGSASGGGLDLRDAARGHAVGPHVDLWRLDPELRQRRADLAAMVRPMVEDLPQPDADRRARLRAVIALHDDHLVGIAIEG